MKRKVKHAIENVDVRIVLAVVVLLMAAFVAYAAWFDDSVLSLCG